VIVVLLIAALAVFGRRAAAYLPQFAQWVHELGPWGPVVFILGYAVAALALVPGSLLTLAGGAIFGLARGTLYVFTGATLSASAAFLIARYLARSAVERRLAGKPRFAAIDRAIQQHGWRIVALLRLSPVFPFSLLNYALGLTRVRFGHYLAACLGMLPGTVLYVYYGKLAGDVAALASGAPVPRDRSYWVLLAVGLAATLAVTVYVTRLARSALREAADV
jgi:uncharacterized membrane protein YdjX (TVP38/TMEM64 family)